MMAMFTETPFIGAWSPPGKAAQSMIHIADAVGFGSAVILWPGGGTDGPALRKL
jgi:hypothetical protein